MSKIRKEMIHVTKKQNSRIFVYAIVALALAFNACKDESDEGKDWEVGKPGPAKGLIFYDKGSFSDGWRYLEAAPTDIPPPGIASWGCKGIDLPGAEGAEVGDGKQNTIDIENGCATVGIAADICANLVVNGYDDWFLPSLGELNLLFQNLHQQGLGNFFSYHYGSSTEDDSDNAWIQNFTTGDQGNPSKEGAVHIRAIRAF